MALKKAPNPLRTAIPRGDRVIVRRDVVKRDAEGNMVTSGGIILPDTVYTPQRQTGTVISVGPGRQLRNGKYIPLDLKKDDRVVIVGYAALSLVDPLDGSNDPDDEYVILREDEVLAILPKDTPKKKVSKHDEDDDE